MCKNAPHGVDSIGSEGRAGIVRALAEGKHGGGTDAPQEKHVMTTQENQPQRAPVQLLAEILKDPDLTDEQKQKCETFLRVRFQNRRRMAAME